MAKAALNLNSSFISNVIQALLARWVRGTAPVEGCGEGEGAAGRGMKKCYRGGGVAAERAPGSHEEQANLVQGLRRARHLNRHHIQDLHLARVRRFRPFKVLGYAWKAEQRGAQGTGAT